MDEMQTEVARAHKDTKEPGKALEGQCCGKQTEHHE